MPELYKIYEKKLMAMGEAESDGKEYVAIPSLYLSNGIFVPGSHPELDRNELAEIEAESADDAVALYREKTDEGFM